MAKKAKAAKPKTSAKKRQTRKQVAKVLTKGPIRQRPKTPTLPGMERMALIASLDRICDSLADIRTQMNDLRAVEKEQTVAALRELRKHSRTVYKSHGIELVRVPGEEKVRVRLVAGQGASDTEDEQEDGDAEVTAMDGVASEAEVPV